MCFYPYETNGSPPPPVTSDPYPVMLNDDIDKIAAEFWGLLDKENKVALVLKVIDMDTGEVRYRIINALTAA